MIKLIIVTLPVPVLCFGQKIEISEMGSTSGHLFGILGASNGRYANRLSAGYCTTNREFVVSCP